MPTRAEGRERGAVAPLEARHERGVAEGLEAQRVAGALVLERGGDEVAGEEGVVGPVLGAGELVAGGGGGGGVKFKFETYQFNTTRRT